MKPNDLLARVKTALWRAERSVELMASRALTAGDHPAHQLLLDLRGVFKQMHDDLGAAVPPPVPVPLSITLTTISVQAPPAAPEDQEPTAEQWAAMSERERRRHVVEWDRRRNR